VGRRAAQGGPAVDRQVVAVDVDPRAQRGEARGDAGDPVGLLVAQLAGATDVGRAVGEGGGQAQDRDLIDRGGDVARTQVDGAELARADRDVGDRLAAVNGRAVRALDDLGEIGAHRGQDVDDRPAGRVDADAAEGELGVRVDRARDEPERRRRDVTRD